MTKLERYCNAYQIATTRWAGDAFWVSNARMWIQDRVESLSPAQRAMLLEADQRLLAIARAETDRGIQADLWDALAYCDYTPEGPTTVA